MTGFPGNPGKEGEMRNRSAGVVLTLLLVLVAGAPMAFAGGQDLRAKRLTGQIEYWFVGHLGMTDDHGRTLVWEATIEGDISGTMKWWFGPSPAPQTSYLDGRVNYYVARWEIWDSEGKRLLLAGDSAGKTVTPANEDGIWDGHGVVTIASKRFNQLKGRHIYETGPVIWDPFPFSGTGIFVIY